MDPEFKEDAIKALVVLSAIAAFLGINHCYQSEKKETFVNTGEINEQSASSLNERLSKFYNDINELISQKRAKLQAEYQDLMLQKPHRYMTLQPQMTQMNMDADTLTNLLQNQENISFQNLSPKQRELLYDNDTMPDEFLQTFTANESEQANEINPVGKLVKSLFIVMAELQKDVEWQPSKEQLSAAQKTYEEYVRSGNLDETTQQEVQTRLHNYFEVTEKKYRHSLDDMKKNSDGMKINDPKAAATLKDSIIQMNKTTYWYQAERLKNPQVTVKGISPSRISILLKDGSFEDFLVETRAHYENQPEGYPHAADKAIVEWDIAETAGKPIIDDYLVTQSRLRKEQADRDAIKANQQQIIHQNEGVIAVLQKDNHQLNQLVETQRQTIEKQKQSIKKLEDDSSRMRRQAEDAAIGGYVVGRALGR